VRVERNFEFFHAVFFLHAIPKPSSIATLSGEVLRRRRRIAPLLPACWFCGVLSGDAGALAIRSAEQPGGWGQCGGGLLRHEPPSHPRTQRMKNRFRSTTAARRTSSAQGATIAAETAAPRGCWRNDPRSGGGAERFVAPFVTLRRSREQDAAWVEQLRGHTADHLFKNNRRGSANQTFSCGSVSAEMSIRWASAGTPTTHRFTNQRDGDFSNTGNAGDWRCSGGGCLWSEAEPACEDGASPPFIPANWIAVSYKFRHPDLAGKWMT